ncbi:multiheme c-type cytochrome [Aquimarina sp. 2201CG14-23]|uniref:multiheme c-type cytochrome n=1 Tax=Aquimarina mycalae TaxID=3040073 RepID=UPI002477DEBF|nr:multiheme c-type cytochrome [Aquimarina sp. 2201CG14-23]MDH7447999.1 multiheme c-type cytochrome [Aquimarina sp. 2201CG14-23]
MQKNTLYTILISIIILGILSYFVLRTTKSNTVEYIAITPIATHSNGMEFIDSSTCVDCHQKIVEEHYKTAHFNSFQPVNKNTIKGSFQKGENTLILNKDVTFHFVEKDSAFYQEPIFNNQNTPFYSAKMDIAVGSGTKGQSYLMWNNNHLLQLQASYFTPTDSWINSPGAPDQLAPARPVLERCLECHTTFVQNISGNKKGNQFHKKNIVYGIDCQRCHGPVQDHVKYHKQHPKDKTAKHIIQYSSLSRQQRLDACALCHSGLRTETTERAFSYMIGDTLKKFSFPDYDESSLEELDVHGNQYGLLKASKCFTKSNALDCITCHDPHKKERGNFLSFNQKCMNCHASLKKTVQCSGDKNNIEKMNNNCIQCHMPLVKSKTMKIQIPKGDEISVDVRTHLIGIYNKEDQH